tara:strand:+ start:28271 stop:29146 length:876 start_codon:yes stop_codon:yes gene_type:complete
MVRPANFGMNTETAGTNSFQTKILLDKAEVIREKAKEEFDTMVAKIRLAGVDVQVFNDSESPIKPDAVFPNNWITTHQNGTVILYPMLANNRQFEVRMDIVNQLRPTQIQDFRDDNKPTQILEGTGSVIFDHQSKVMYLCHSPRTDQSLAKKLAEQFDFTICSFDATDHQNIAIYHTNVLMFVMHDIVGIGLETIKNVEERERVIETIHASGKQILDLSYYQITQFAGNMIQLKNNVGEFVLVASQTAWDSLNSAQKRTIQDKTKVIPVAIPTIETYGGGSARCMIAENYL